MVELWVRSFHRREPDLEIAMNSPQTSRDSGIATLLSGAPSNWNRWGARDELGVLNEIGPAEVLRGIAAVRSGKTFTLGTAVGRPGGDPSWPGRVPAQRFSVVDRSDVLAGKGEDLSGGLETAEDVLINALHAGTHCDALGHAWYDGKLYNGVDAIGTTRALEHASIEPIAAHGMVGRGVLIDLPRFMGKEHLDPSDTFTHEELIACATAQGSEIQSRDFVLIRTGWLSALTRMAPVAEADFAEPGLRYTLELARWFHDRDIAGLITDTIANEATVDQASGVMLPLHGLLLRDLGVSLTEIAELDTLAEDCASDGQYEFLYAAAPLRIVGATAGPVNPIAIK
ncbi:cyclase family protein [Mycolicibacterium sp.]|uniref:cyclase family protein n=1 Tax=Mycolicibacterium sp. TaxID=2320850 RepID=UPI003D1188B7